MADQNDAIYLKIYDQLKALENGNQLPFPIPREIIDLGTINLTFGTFQYAVPTITKTVVLPPPNIAGGPKTNTVIQTPVGVVTTNTVDLVLRFKIEAFEAQASIVEPTNDPAPVPHRPNAGPNRMQTQASNAGKLSQNPNSSGVTITDADGQFSTLSSTASEILIDMGRVLSRSLAQEAPNMDPAVSSFGLTINLPGGGQLGVELIIARPPVLAMGAFTVPALPITIVYAPPQGKLNKNTATYAESTTITRTMTTTITSSTAQKTAEAYSTGDLVTKAIAAIGTVAALLATGGASGAAAAPGTVSGSDALTGILTGIIGGAGTAVGTVISTAGSAVSAGASAIAGAASAATGGDPKETSFSDNLKTLQSQVSSVNSLVQGLPPANNDSANATLTHTTDHTISAAVTNTAMLGTVPGKGPGVGDRIIYVSDLKLMWMALDGDVFISVLGFADIAQYGAQELLQELTSLDSGQSTDSKLDAATIKMLLKFDPFIDLSKPLQSGQAIVDGPPVIGPPRFMPASLPSAQGGDTGTSGDTFSISYDLTTDDKSTSSSVTSTVTETKPGWMAVIFGADNVDATTTLTTTNTQSVDVKSEDKITCSITFFSQGEGDPYNVKFFFDRTFQTLLGIDAGSPLLGGNPNFGKATTTP